MQLLQDEVDLLVCEQGGDVAPQVLAVVLSVVVALPAGVDPQAGVTHMVPALAAQLACARVHK